MNRLLTLLLKTNRLGLQVGAFVILNSYFLPWLKHIPCLALNCHACPLAVFACPIGGLQNFAIIRQFPFYTLGILGTVAALVGRLSCGWFCPFGLLQDLLYRVKLPKLNLSNNLGWFRYAILFVLVGLIPLLTLEPWFCKLCPLGALEAGIPLAIIDGNVRAQIGWFFALKLVLLLLFIIWMVITKRPFCRFICPLGAIYGIFNRFSALQLRVDQAQCSRCNRCQQACPTDVRIYDKPNSTQCIRCLDCVEICPTSAISYLT